MGTVNPVDDFKQLITQDPSHFEMGMQSSLLSEAVNEELLHLAFKSLAEITQKLIFTSFGTHTYSKALECVRTLRSYAIEVHAKSHSY